MFFGMILLSWDDMEEFAHGLGAILRTVVAPPMLDRHIVELPPNDQQWLMFPPENPPLYSWQGHKLVCYRLGSDGEWIVPDASPYRSEELLNWVVRRTFGSADIRVEVEMPGTEHLLELTENGQKTVFYWNIAKGQNVVIIQPAKHKSDQVMIQTLVRIPPKASLLDVVAIMAKI